MSEKEKDEALEEIALEYQDIITTSYDKLATDCFNVPNHRLEMKTEAVIRAAYFRATRRYAQWITKQEGVVREVIDIKGLEFKKANFPPLLGKFFKEILIDILKGASQEGISERVNAIRKQILNSEISFMDLGNPTAVKTLAKYSGRKAMPGEIFSEVLKGAPAPVKAAITYNDLIKFWGLHEKHSYISQGEKIKWVYLKQNPLRIESVAFLEHNIPDKVRAFIEENIDREKIFNSILFNKLKGFFDDLL